MKASLIGALALVCLATPALADPRDGVWQSNEAKSFWSDGKFPKGFKLRIELKWLPGKLVYRATNTTNPDKPYLNNFEASLDDKVGPLNDNARFNEIRIKPLSPDTFQVLEQKDGDVIVGQYWRFADDGRSLVRWGIGKAPDGRSKAFLEWFDKVG